MGRSAGLRQVNGLGEASHSQRERTVTAQPLDLSWMRCPAGRKLLVRGGVEALGGAVAVESFFPADRATVALMRAAAP